MVMSLGDFFLCTLLVGLGAVYSCGKGYEMGYESHREDVCTRAGGVWMERVSNGKRACVTGERL